MNREDVDWLFRESSPLSPLPSSQEDPDADADDGDGDGDDETVALSPTALRSPRSPSPNKVGATEHEHDTDLRASKRPRMSTDSESSVPSLQLARDATPPPDQARDNDAQQVPACRRDEATSVTPHAPPIATIDTAETTIPPRTDDAYLQQQYMPANGAALMLQDRVVEAMSSWINEPSSMVWTSYGASQEVRQLQQELGSQDLDDWTPSSQAVPSSPAMAGLVSGRDPATDETGADDSGIFVKEPDCAEDDGEKCVGNGYAEEAEPVGVDVEAETEVEASAAAEAVDDDMEDYEGDDMWDTARLDDLDGELGLFQPTTKPTTVEKGKVRAQDVDDDDDEPYLEEENTEEQLRQFGFGHVPLGFEFANSQAQEFSVGTFVFRSKAMSKEISKAELNRIKALLDADDEDDQGGEQPTTQRPVIATRELPAFVPPMLNRPGGRTQGTDRPREMASKVPVSTPQFARPLIVPTSQAPNLPPSSRPLTPHTASMAPSSDVFGSGSRSAAPLAFFSRANGRPLPAPSEDALQVSRAMMEFSPPRARPSSRGLPSPNPNHKVDTPTKVSRRSPLLSIENGFAPARAVLPSSSIATAEVELPTVSPSPNVPLPVSTAQVATPQPIRTSMRPSSAFRPPFLGSPTAVTSTPAGVKTAPAMRRLNLGMTPRARVGVNGSPVPKFTTPFKNGKRPEGLTPAGIARVDRTPAKAQGSNAARATSNNIQSAATEVVRRRNTTSVFDFSAPKEPRQSLREFGLYPGTVDEAALRALGIPLEIIQMDHMRAEKYAFPGGFGAAQALQSLFFAGCDYATLPWVANHWSLVVWKLASYVRVRPTMYRQVEWWSFQAAIRQLKYRYEREINQAQRSCIKRIQERDSSSSLPMVLCVSKIRYGDPNSFGDEVEESHTGRKDVAGLELTDGWYRIRANVDATLKSAVEREKVRVGSKIAVSGARLENSFEGIDVLEALYTTSLAITGNSTSLAQWDARLGFTGHAFTATLRSLSPAGGVVPLLDVIVERVFPRGYIDAGKGSGGEPWNEVEERRRQEEWLVSFAPNQISCHLRLMQAVPFGQNESAKARNGGDKAAKAMALWDELTDMLREAVETSSNGPETARSSAGVFHLPKENSSKTDGRLGFPDDHDPDEVLDRLKEAASRFQRANIVRRLSSQHVTSCLDKLAERAEIAKERRSRGYDVDESMQRAPRNVRSFRVIRIRDALVTDETKSQRTAQLTVWDCDNLGDDFLREGKRYMISNAVPKGVWNLRSSEITLSTRKDAKWKRLAASGVPIDNDVDSL